MLEIQQKTDSWLEKPAVGLNGYKMMEDEK